MNLRVGLIFRNRVRAGCPEDSRCECMSQPVSIKRKGTALPLREAQWLPGLGASGRAPQRAVKEYSFHGARGEWLEKDEGCPSLAAHTPSIPDAGCGQPAALRPFQSHLPHGLICRATVPLYFPATLD